MEDFEIIALFFARTEEAIGALSQKYGAACGAIAKNILKNDLDAEECVNDAYLALWNRIPPERPEPLRAYVFRIVRNISIARYHANTAAKRNSHYDTALEELERSLASSNTVEQEIEAKELALQIDRFLDALEPENRLLFLCRYWYAESIPELALRFHMSRHAVTVRLSRIRERLKKHLRKEGFAL